MTRLPTYGSCPAYCWLIWIAWVYAFGFASGLAVAFNGGGGQFGAGLLCVIASVSIIFITAGWIVAARMASTLGVSLSALASWSNWSGSMTTAAVRLPSPPRLDPHRS